MNTDDRLKALDAAVTQIEKAYGKGSIMRLGDSDINMNIWSGVFRKNNSRLTYGGRSAKKGRNCWVY